MPIGELRGGGDGVGGYDGLLSRRDGLHAAADSVDNPESQMTLLAERVGEDPSILSYRGRGEFGLPT